MKIVMVMFDSLNRHMLPSYGCDWVHAPNFARLAQRTVQFNKSYVCSMPCMPARRDLHTGRPNFLHRGWSPLEPFDESVFEILRKEKRVYSHLATDHYHYWEDGGATYHGRYDTFEFFRGQEGDPWIGQVTDPVRPDCIGRNNAQDKLTRQDWVNRAFMRSEDKQSQPQTFGSGLEFLRRNKDADNWICQIETFDPHEPFFSQRKYKDLYAAHYDRYRKMGGKHFDWPWYKFSEEKPEEIEHLRFEYAALLSMCDAYMGEVLDAMDEMKLWDDTMLIVWTDHGFMLGEHNCCAKIWMPFYEEVAHTPFFIWDPRCRKAGETRESLVQPSIDLPLTMLDFFGAQPTKNLIGKNLRDTIASDTPVREAGIFGVFGSQVNITDGRYLYWRAPANEANQPLFEYTLMPTRMSRRFTPDELQQATLAEPFSFTHGAPTLKIPAGRPYGNHPEIRKTRLFDLSRDPNMETPITDAKAEQRMLALLKQLMHECDAPAEQYERLGV
jgi:arylsulfatase A-like enzyme